MYFEDFRNLDNTCPRAVTIARVAKFNPEYPHSPVPGVSWNAKLAKWQVRMTVDGRYRYFGSYLTQEQAEAVARRVENGERPPGRPPGRTSVSGVAGVTLHSTGRWHVRFRVDGRQCSFGLYADLDEAREVAERARRGEIVPGTNHKPATPRTGRGHQRSVDKWLELAAEKGPRQEAKLRQARLPYLHPRRRPEPLCVDDPFPRDIHPPIPETDPLRHTRANPLSEEQRRRLITLAQGPGKRPTTRTRVC